MGCANSLYLSIPLNLKIGPEFKANSNYFSEAMADIMQIFLSIILWLLISTATAYFANQRGRDPLVWFMVGMLLGFLGLLLLFLLPPVNEEVKPPEEAEYQILDQPKETSLTTLHHDYLIKDWYYYDADKNRQGPIRFEILKNLWKEGTIGQDTFVWSEGMDKWKKIEEVQNLHTQLQLS